MLFFPLQKVDKKQDAAHQIECTGEEAAIKGSQKGNQNGSGKQCTEACPEMIKGIYPPCHSPYLLMGYKNPADNERLAEKLRMAGLPEQMKYPHLVVL